MPLAIAASLAVMACATSFVPLRVSDAVTGARGQLHADVKAVWLSDGVPPDGFGDDSVLAVEVELHNEGAQPVSLNPTSFACVMEIDTDHPSETLSLLPGGGAEGPFPRVETGERSALAPVVIPPGGKHLLWVMFRGYRFPGSEVPRRIILKIPLPDGQPIDLTLADPARGRLRWTLAPSVSDWTVGFLNTSLYSNHLKATVVATQVSRVGRWSRFLWELGLASSVLVQTRGALTSSTSSFTGSGLAARVSGPLMLWGTAREPRQIGLYVGGTAQLLLENQVPQLSDNAVVPTFYGLLTAEVGLELDIGAVHLAATPFPLSQLGHPLPRWSATLGYTHWWVAGGGTDGYISGLRLAW